MKRIFLLLLILAAGGAAFWVAGNRSAGPEVPFTKVKRETIIDTLSTNGKVEPLQFSAVRAEREGIVDRVYVEKGQKVSQGGLLLTFDSRTARADLASAESRIQQARLERETLDAGGRAPELSDIASNISRAQTDLKTAENTLASLQRLQAKGAVTKQDVQDAQVQVDRLQLQIQALQQRRSSLVTTSDKRIADAKIRDAELAATVARQRVELSEVRSPADGTVYQFDVRTGAYLNPGDLIASIGRLDRVRVIIYVDEPELGRVQVGMPVTITWDAQPGRKWQGTVEKVPTQIVALGTRQVGEVSCIVENQEGQLLPGTNITAEIRSRVVENSVSIPRETLRRENGETGVYVLQGNQLAWRKIQTGVSSVSRTQVMQGLTVDESVALPTDQTLKNGMVVRPTYPGT